MFQQFLSSADLVDRLGYRWVKEIAGLVRVAIADPIHEVGYVVVYREQHRQYAVHAFDIATGSTKWTHDLINGGYGSPALVGDVLVVLSKFTNVVGLSRMDGQLLWEIETPSRIRSSISTHDNKVYFSSGGTLFEVGLDGKIGNSWSFDGAFFFGAVCAFREFIISLGTLEDETGSSISRIFAFHKSGKLAYCVPLSFSPVVSSDTTGICWDGDYFYVGGDGIVAKYWACDGSLVWRSEVEGFAARHTCIVDDERVYYVTQEGEVGALDRKDGSVHWKLITGEGLVASPLSLAGDRLLLLADGFLSLVDGATGKLLQSLPVGHSPYSMASLVGDTVLVGAGEPPHHGLLCAFNTSSNKNELKLLSRCSNAFIESPEFDILVEVLHAPSSIQSVSLEVGAIGCDRPIEGVKIQEASYAFRVPLINTVNPGRYALPMKLHFDSSPTVVRSILFTLKRRKALPRQSYLGHIPEFTQEKPNFSGAAIGEMLKKLNGNPSMDQRSMRGMIDACREKSGYELFQTWRILLRRVLASSATCKEELPEFCHKSNRADLK